MENLIHHSDITLTLIAACGPRGELGRDGSLPWHQPADLKFFKKITQNSVVICGRKTFESLPKLLPGRKHIVVSSHKKTDSHHDPDIVCYVSCWEQACEAVKKWGFERAFLIGGAQLYRNWADKAQYCWITHFNMACEADCFFPLEVLQQRPIVEQHRLEADSLNWARTHVLYGPLK